ncbi:hypothetical protein IDH09_01490 [Pelagibacterales bacterium SAG-MED28]|nr:hypothetical protein [Pelagibacterales bacterium SAG-MED28]
MKYYNRGIVAHLTAAIDLLDDDHLLFENIQGQGPIDIVRINIKTGEVELYDVKCDDDKRHRKRYSSEIQKKLGVKNYYVNLHKRTKRVEGKVEKL